MDVIVIGGGVIGCAIAFELSARGANVRVLEKRDICLGASWASAGVLCPWIEGNVTTLTPMAVESVNGYHAFLERVSARAGAVVESRRCGTLEVAFDEFEATHLTPIAAAHGRAGVPHSLLTGREAATLEPMLSNRVASALLVPSHGYVAVPALTLALAAAAARQGTVFRPLTEVTGIEASGAGLQVRSADETWRTDVVVLAAGAWASRSFVQVVPGAPVRPVRGQLLYLRQPTPLVHSIWSPRGYLVPWNDGTVLAGATVEEVGFDERATVEGMATLMHAAREMVPSLASAEFREVRVGLRPASEDGLPIIGRSSHLPGLVYATGHGRNGIMLAPLTATLVADLVLDGRAHPYLQLTAPQRFGL